MKNKFIRFVCLLIAAATVATAAPFAAYAAETSDQSEASAAVSETSETSAAETEIAPAITSGNAIAAYCIDDEQFLYTARGDEIVAPTVITKLVTTMVAMDILKEKGLDPAMTEVTVTSTAIDNAGDVRDFRVPMMGFKAGSVYKARDLISATLVANANDACAALACYCGEVIGGNIITFIQRMNAKVESLGLKNTVFVNPTGLDVPNQTTTPREAALIAAAFYRYNELVNLSDVDQFHFNNSSVVRNKNYLKSNYYIDGYLNKKAIGLIAGQKDRSGDYCLVTASQKDGRTYILLVMCATGLIVDADKRYSLVPGNAYDDMKKLIDWTLESFVFTPVALAEFALAELRVDAGGSTDHVLVGPARDVEKLVLKSQADNISFNIRYDDGKVFKSVVDGVEADTVSAPVTKGMKVGTVTFYCAGNEVAEVDLVAMNDVEADTVKSMFSGVKDFLFGKVMKTVLIILGALVALYIIVALTMATLRAAKRIKKAKGKSDPGNSGKKLSGGNDKNKKLPPKSGSDGDDMNHTIRAR